MPELHDITPDEAIDIAGQFGSSLSIPDSGQAFMAGMLLIIREILVSDCACAPCVKFRETISAMESS